MFRGERPRLGDMGGDKTLSECHNVDLGCVPTHRHHGKKIQLSLAHSFFSSTYFHEIIHVLDLRDHSLALPCLVSYLVVSL